jgi:hypothetical protein
MTTSCSKLEKTGWEGRNFRSILFYNFFFEIDAKFDADFNETGPEAKKRLLHGEKRLLSGWEGRNFKIVIFEKFFFKSM